MSRWACCRYGWDLGCSFLRGILTLKGKGRQGGKEGSSQADMMTGKDWDAAASSRSKGKLLDSTKVGNMLRRVKGFAQDRS